MRYRGILSTLVLLVLLIAGTSTLATANVGWSSPLNLSDWYTPAGEGHFSLDRGPEGTQLAAWAARDGSGQWALWARVRPPGGDWEQPSNVSGWGDYVFKIQPTQWSSGVAPDGTAWLLWIDIDSPAIGDKVRIQAAHRPPGPGQFWQLHDLTEGAYEPSIRWAELQIGPDGHMAAAWVACAASTTPGDGPCHVRVRRRPAGASAWKPVEQVDATFSGEGISEARVMVGPGGQTVVLWLQTDTSTPAQWALMSLAYWPTPAPGGWEASPLNVSGWRPYLYLGQPVIDPGGTITAAWRSSTADPNKQAYYANTRTTGGTWSPTPAQISPGRQGYATYAPEMAVGHNGTVTAAWVVWVGSTETYLFANTRDAGSAWAGEALVHGGAGLIIGDETLRVRPDGSALAFYILQDTGRDPARDTHLRWAVRPPHGAWGGGGQGEIEPWMASITGSALRLADDGSAVAAWSVRNSANPAAEQYGTLAATMPPFGQFEPFAELPGWNLYSWVHTRSLLAQQEIWPAAVLWQITRSDSPSDALLYSEMGTGKHLVYLPLILRNWH